MRAVSRDVLPSARIRELERQQPELTGTVSTQDEERNALLAEIRESIRRLR